MGFQENLRAYREKAGYATAKDFAEKLELPYATYAAYENKNREPRFSTLIKIADLLNISVDELLGRKDNILGNNDDEMLKGLLNEVFESYEPKILKLNKVEENYIFIDIVNNNNEIVHTATFSKGMFIDYVNGLRRINKKKEIKQFYEYLFQSSFNVSFHFLEMHMNEYKMEYSLVNFNNNRKEIKKILPQYVKWADSLSKLIQIYKNRDNIKYILENK